MEKCSDLAQLQNPTEQLLTLVVKESFLGGYSCIKSGNYSTIVFGNSKSAAHSKGF